MFERRCPGCGQRSAGICPACRSLVLPAPPLPGDGWLSSVRAWSCYDGVGRAVVLALKHGGRRDLAAVLGPELADLAPPVDVVTWVPASPAGRRARGYDQSQLLGRAVGRALSRPAIPLLRRSRRSGSQRGHGRSERLDAAALTGRRRSPPIVLLVDDVRTTGASLRRAAAALGDAGAQDVHAVVVAVADRDLTPGRPSFATTGGAARIGPRPG